MTSGKTRFAVLAMVTISSLSACRAEQATPTSDVLADCFISFEIAAWEDADGNGLRDPAEAPLEGAEFALQGAYAQIWGEPCLSDADGELIIRIWYPGGCTERDYTITAVPPDSYEFTTPSSLAVSLGPGDFTWQAQFGFRPPSN